jgi:hypothetical protein
MSPEAKRQENRQMIRKSAAQLAVMAALAASAIPAQAEGPISISFAAAPIGALPPGFTAERTGGGAAADWTIIKDDTAASGRVLAQTSGDRTDYRFPLAIYQPVSTANVEVSVRFKAVAGSIDRAAGIAVRLADRDNYYVVRANALEDNVNLYRVIKGSRSQIQGIRHKVSSGAWHTLGLKVIGDRFVVSFDGAELYSANDRSLPQAGKIGLWTKADSVTHFAELTITPLP